MTDAYATESIIEQVESLLKSKTGGIHSSIRGNYGAYLNQINLSYSLFALDLSKLTGAAFLRLYKTSLYLVHMNNGSKTENEDLYNKAIRKYADLTSDAVWVDSKLRGRGIATWMYNIAHDFTDRGLASTDNLGTMSVGMWCSLARKHREIFLLRDDGERVDADFSGAIPVVDGKPITRVSSGYRFIWPK